MSFKYLRFSFSIGFSGNYLERIDLTMRELGSKMAVVIPIGRVKLLIIQHRQCSSFYQVDSVIWWHSRLCVCVCVSHQK